MSDGQDRESNNARKGRDSRPERAGEKKGRKQGSADVGRALRSVYDDTLREAVPDDFLNLLGKLS